MNKSRFLAALAWLMLSAANVVATNQVKEFPPERTWDERAWEIRYILFIDHVSNFAGRGRASREINMAPQRPHRERVYLDVEEMFEPTATFIVPGRNDPLALVLIQFDRAGHASTSSARLNQYTAKHNMLDDLVLVRTNSVNEKPNRLARWWPGAPRAENFSPAVCAGDDSARYEKGWRKDDSSGGFGCREWTAQLYRWERPYIDVTSYQEGGNFIGAFVGWARFTDAPKPVIGLQGKTWLCLHDCPAGEVPGIIPSIKAWTTKNHFPMPKQPIKQPEFPDSDYEVDVDE